MTAAEEHAVARWQEAAKDLGFKFVSPFTLEDRGETLSYLGWLPQFGSKRGILIVTTEDSSLRNRQLFVADARGYAVSGMQTGVGHLPSRLHRGTPKLQMNTNGPNQTMKPTAPLQCNFIEVVAAPGGLSFSR